MLTASSRTVIFTVHTACIPAPHSHSHHYQCRTPYAAVHTIVLLMMGIMMPETCWDSLTINIRLVASCWFLSLHPNSMTCKLGHVSKQLSNCIVASSPLSLKIPTLDSKEEIAPIHRASSSQNLLPESVTDSRCGRVTYWKVFYNIKCVTVFSQNQLSLSSTKC